MSLEHFPTINNAEHLNDTIDAINAALEAPDFNEGDRQEVLESLAFFEAHQERMMAVAGRTIRSAEIAA